MKGDVAFTDQRRERSTLRLLVVLGEGGHSRQMLQLLEQLGASYEYHYVLADADTLSEHKIRQRGPIHRVARPRTKLEGRTDNPLLSAWQTLHSLAQLWPIVRQVRPHAVLANGPSVAVPAVVIGKLLGAAVIWVETASRVYDLSTSARIAYRLADLFIVQWPQLREKYPRAIYAGRLL